MCVHTHEHTNVTASGDQESKTVVSVGQFLVLAAVVERHLPPLAPGFSLTPPFPLTFYMNRAISSGLPGKPEPSLHLGRSNLITSPSSLPPCVNFRVQLLVLEGEDTAVSGRYFHNSLRAPCHLWPSLPR